LLRRIGDSGACRLGLLISNLKFSNLKSQTLDSDL
jgi:hypothetical protein